jgi:hypothetical protein
MATGATTAHAGTEPNQKASYNHGQGAKAIGGGGPGRQTIFVNQSAADQSGDKEPTPDFPPGQAQSPINNPTNTCDSAVEG